ncbi:unnamed protein product [Prunus armeniaca]
MARDWVPNWSELLTVLGVGFPVGMGLRFLLDLGCPTCVNAGLLFTLLHIANLTSLLSSLGEILENLYSLSKRGVAVHPKLSRARQLGEVQLVVVVTCDGWQWATAVVKQVGADGPAVAYHRRPHQLSGYREEVGGLTSAQDVERRKHNGPALDDLLAGCVPLRKKPRIPYAEKTQVRVVPSSSVRVKHLVGVDSRKVGGMHGVRGVLPEPPTDKIENHNLLPGRARAQSRSTEHQRDAKILFRSSSRLHQLKDEDQSGKSAQDPAC